MSEPAKKKATYEDLHSVPGNMIGEIINGELVVTARPAPMHMNVASILGGEIMPPYRFGRGGPGGWIILDETEIMLGEDLLAPDIAGWRKERFPGWPKENWISIPPDWICEILSPTTASKDRVKKMRTYAMYEVGYAWIIDPREQTLEIFKLKFGEWVRLDAFAENDKMRAEPFLEIEINLANLWIEES